MTGWLNDLRIGVRLAVGGGRTSIARLALSAAGIGIATAVLLLAASVEPMIQAREDRSAAGQPDTTAVDGVAPLRLAGWVTAFQDKTISVESLYPTGPTSPVPPGLPRMPADGEIYLSPALADLMAADGSTLLRERFPQRVVGTIDPMAVTAPDSLTAYLGSGPITAPQVIDVYSFGVPRQGSPMDPGLLLLVLLGSVALLVPVFIFITSSTRIAGAERDRKLSALRLVGGDSRQVRRIAAAESLVSAVIGLVLGVGVFLVSREAAAGVRIMDITVYPSDITPTWWLAVLVGLSIPVLAVLTAQFALRRTIIEPLSVVRFSKPVRRRMAWRLAVVGFGVALLLYAAELSANDHLWSAVIATGTTLLLVGVPLLLPWVVERTVSGLRGGPSSWQLAIRRLQLDSGTSARVVSGVAVVLAAAIALQGVLLSMGDRFEATPDSAISITGSVLVSGTSEGIATTEKELSALLPGAKVEKFRDVAIEFDGDGSISGIRVADCAVIERRLNVTGCADGQLFSPSDDVTGATDGLTPGRKVNLVETRHTIERYGQWTVPATRRRIPPQAEPEDLKRVNPEFLMGPIVAEGASAPASPPVGAYAGLYIPTADDDAVERVRTAVARTGWNTYVAQDWSSFSSPQEEMFTTIRRALLGGSLFTLLLAGISLLVLALEHIRERRRPLAILAASGVPTGALARSLFWQIAVPIGLGVVLALAVGLSLGGLIMRLSSSTPYQVDWAGVGVMTAAAVVLGLLVSVLTLPFLRGATRLSSMRTE
ncbi:putative integral membrane protein [Alloactinosynnema sp. L-07]|uniref:ABC transporter permease n=1 Tax=Alloactinosynnema sp. L-07 TaxID=1653480 RepID=UPI00065F01B7|nr:ABC transporter permease [Alloactinosynnema sp. L-07]CRK60287.1 putative integral membrane protein [Alloactinosynnema sp. L-07]